MAQPFELKFTTNLGDLVGDLQKYADGLAQAAQVVGEMGEAAAPVTEAVNAVSMAAQENAGAIAGMAAAVTEAAAIENTEAAELARLTELLGSEDLARRSMNAQIIDGNAITVQSEAEVAASLERRTALMAAVTAVQAERLAVEADMAQVAVASAAEEVAATEAVHEVQAIALSDASQAALAKAEAAEAAQILRVQLEDLAQAQRNLAEIEREEPGNLAAIARLQEEVAAEAQRVSEAENVANAAKLKAAEASQKLTAEDERAAAAAKKLEESARAGTFTGRTQELGSMLTMLGLLDPQLLRVGVGVQMLGQVAETLGPKIAAAGGGVAGFLAVLAPIVGIGAAVSGVLAGVGAAAALLGDSIKQAIPEQEFETTFAILLGNVQNAKARLEELDQIALQFHLDPNEVRSASEQLTRLSQGALGSGKSLETVIEMSARTGKSLSEMGAIYGWLYEVINSGEPIGRMSTQLVRAGVISASTANLLANLQKEGASGAQVWAALEAALNKYSGAAAARAKTLEGETLGIRAAWDLMLEGFGRPIVDALTPYAAKIGSVMAVLVRVAAETGQVLGVVIKSGAGLTVLAALLTGNFNLAFALIAGVMARTSTLVQASGALIVADVRSVFDSVVAYLEGIASKVFIAMTETFGKALAATENFAAQMAAKLSFLPDAVRGGIVGALGGGKQDGADMTSAIVGGIQGVADASRKTAEQAQADADKARKAWDDVLKSNQPAAPNQDATFQVPEGGTILPDSKGVKDRTKAVNEGKIAEKEYKDALDATKGLLEAGQLSESQAAQRDIDTTRAYIATLEQQQAKMNPASEAYQRLTRDIDLARGALIKLKEGEGQYQEALALTKSKVDAGIISQDEANAENNRAITAQIARSRDARAETLAGSAAYQQLTTKINELYAALQKTTVIGSMVQGLRQLANEWTDVAKKAGEAAKEIANQITSGIGNAITGLIEGTQTWQQAFQEAGKAVISTLVQMVVQYTVGRLLMAAINAIASGGEQATAESGASAAATAWAPAATSASIASYGTAAAVGVAAYVAAMGTGVAAAAGMSGSFQVGGHTGYGRDDEPAGIVHRNEYVMSAPVVRAWGLDTLRAMSQLRIPVTGPRSSLAGAAGAAASVGGYSPTGRASGPRAGRGSSAGTAQHHTYVFFDEDAMAKHMAGTKGTKTIVNAVTGHAVQLGLKS